MAINGLGVNRLGIKKRVGYERVGYKRVGYKLVGYRRVDTFESFRPANGLWRMGRLKPFVYIAYCTNPLG